MTISQKQLFTLAGVGLAASGIVTIFLLYQTYWSEGSPNSPAPGQDQTSFQLEEIHASPSLVMHIHAHLSLMRGGEAVVVPEEIGITPELWKDHSLDEYGPSSGLLAPMHTHDSSGTIHIESTVDREYTLGEFLRIWGMDPGDVVKVTDTEGNEIQDHENLVLERNAQLVVQIS
ncbi:MAG TPA: hypothetical protein VIE86_00900 [Nitrososphaera sp.]